MKGCFSILFWAGLLLAIVGVLSFFLQSQPEAIYYPTKLIGLLIIFTGILGLVLGLKAPPITYYTALGITIISVILLGIFIVRSFFSYQGESIQFTNGSVQLKGTLIKPYGSGPFPGVVLLHDAQLNTARENQVFAEFFARRGMAVLTFDKRGYGQSQGTLPYSIYDLAGDARAAYSYLEALPDVEQSGFWALGEGTRAAVLAATQMENKPAFMIMVSSSGLSPAAQRHWLYEKRARHQGLNATERSWVKEILDKMDEYYRTGESEEEILAQIERIKPEAWFRKSMNMEPDQTPKRLNDWFSDWHYPEDLDLDVLPFLEQLATPCLFIFGDEDANTPVSLTITSLERINSQSKGKKDWRILSFPNADHYIMTPQDFFHPRFFKNMDQWLTEKIKETPD